MKKLKVGLVGGGGNDAFFGRVHERAICLDGTRELTAGVLRSDSAACLEEAEKWGIKGFGTVDEMLAAVDGGEQIDYVTITTPNFAHYDAAKACLEAGMPVLCEKPMTITLEEAEDLAAMVRLNNTPFVLAHTYTGHPMMMLAREMIARGDIGEVRKIEAWYTQGWLADPLEESGQQQAAWRTDPKRAGISCCGGDIGTHAFIAATWVTGLAVKNVWARLSTFVPGRPLDDDFNVIAEMENGSTAIITATQVAIGYKNDNGLRVFGSDGSLEWHQEQAEKLLVRRGQHDDTYWLGANFDFFPAPVASYLRTPAGHHEDFFEALANLHCTMERMVRRKNGEEVQDPYPHPDVEDGVAGMKFVQAAVESSKNDGKRFEL